jgi:hypothetical protein
VCYYEQRKAPVSDCSYSRTTAYIREHVLHYRGPGFLTVVSFGSTPIPLPHSPVSKLDQRHIGKLRKRDNLLTREGGGEEEIVKSYDGEKAWSSIIL